MQLNAPRNNARWTCWRWRSRSVICVPTVFEQLPSACHVVLACFCTTTRTQCGERPHRASGEPALARPKVASAKTHAKKQKQPKATSKTSTSPKKPIASHVMSGTQLGPVLGCAPDHPHTASTHWRSSCVTPTCQRQSAGRSSRSLRSSSVTTRACSVSD